MCASCGWKLFRSSKCGCWRSWLHTYTSVKCTQVGAAKLSSVQAVIPWLLNRVPLHSGWHSLVQPCWEASLGNLCAGETTTNCLHVVAGSSMLWGGFLCGLWVSHKSETTRWCGTGAVSDICLSWLYCCIWSWCFAVYSFPSLGCCNAVSECFRNPAPSGESVPVLCVSWAAMQRHSNTLTVSLKINTKQHKEKYLRSNGKKLH